jgi:hypothetical protein
MLDVRLYWPMKTTGPTILTRNLSMRFPGELRIKMNGSPMNKENIQPAFAMDGLRPGEHPTPKAFASKASNSESFREQGVQPSTNYGAFP